MSIEKKKLPIQDLPLLVCFSHLRWGFVYQRPQHLMSQASNTYRVLFWEEPIFEPRIKPHLDRYRQTGCLEVITPKLPAGLSEAATNKILERLLTDLISSEDPVSLALWYLTPAMLPFSRHLRADPIVYDKMDELSAFKNAPPELLLCEAQLLKKADVVFTGGMSIYEANMHAHFNIHPFPSSIDKAHFAKARSRKIVEPHDQAGISGPRVGWFGVIDERMNIDLVAEVAAIRRDWNFVMLGPVVKIDPRSLPQAANLHWLGGKDYRDLPGYLAGWDAGFIPFAINDATEYISPTKTPEFLAAGVPVVATPIRDIVRPYGDLQLVEIANTALEVVSGLDRLIWRPRATWLARADEFLRDKSWDRTWMEMAAIMGPSVASRYVEAA